MADTVTALLEANFQWLSDTFANFRFEHLHTEARQAKLFCSKYDEEMCASIDVDSQIILKKTRQPEEE